MEGEEGEEDRKRKGLEEEEVGTRVMEEKVEEEQLEKGGDVVDERGSR